MTFESSFEWLRQYWWVTTPAFLLLGWGMLIYLKTRAGEQLLMLLMAITLLIILPTVGTVFALNANDPLNDWGADRLQDFAASFVVHDDYGDTWFRVFGSMMTMLLLMLAAGFAFLLGRDFLESVGEQAAAEREQRRL
jgi:hypothetical protein